MKIFSFLKIVIVAQLMLLLIQACDTQPRTKSRKKDESEEASTLYIGVMYYFAETQEFYTPVFVNPDLDMQDEETLLPMLDSTIQQTPDLVRKRFPLKKAKEIFMLYGMDSVRVFDTNNEFILQADLQRVEYMKNNSEGKFVAIFKGPPLSGELSAEYYCMSDTLESHRIADFSYGTIQDPSLNNFLLHQLKGEANKILDMKNIEVQPSGAVYSVITTPNQSFITEWYRSRFSILKDMNATLRIGHILPLPFEVNDKPLLLVTLYVPGQPMRTPSLAVYSDIQEYRILKYNRLQLVKQKHVVEFQFNQ